MTMSAIKREKRTTSKEQEAKQVIKCLKKQLAWCNQSNVTYDSSEEQYSILPRAIADEDGKPHKANESNWTIKLQSHYESAKPPVFINIIPWSPQAVITEAMFLIIIKPLRRNIKLEYAKFLLNQFVLEHFKVQTKEVHFIFDNPSIQKFNLKQFEHTRCYNTNKKHSSQHEHSVLTTDSNILLHSLTMERTS